jgi:hypothetical protein
MTWRRQTRAEADAEARAEWYRGCLEQAENGRLLAEFIEAQEDDRIARLEASRPALHNLTSAQLLDVIHDGFGDGMPVLPCDQHDVITAVLDELRRRRLATAHERLRLRDLDRRG